MHLQVDEESFLSLSMEMERDKTMGHLSNFYFFFLKKKKKKERRKILKASAI